MFINTVAAVKGDDAAVKVNEKTKECNCVGAQRLCLRNCHQQGKTAASRGVLAV